MYGTTIEPRLLADLLNVERPSSSITLPPLQDPNVLKAPGRPHTLEPNTHTSNQERSTVKSSAQKLPRILSADPKNTSSKNGLFSQEHTDKERQSLSKILQGADESPTHRSISKKRHRSDGDSHKDDFVQLPQPPPKKQRAPKQVVPPIIIGLFDPPANAALFPPIASSAFHDSHGRNSLNVNVPTEKGKERENERGVSSENRTHAIPRIQVNNPIRDEVGSSQKTSTKRKDKFPSRRKKWTEEETNQLLLGVHKYGIGKWKAILGDSLYKFNDRSPSDLKDRFRTICPAEIQGESKDGQSSKNAVEKGSSKEAEKTVPEKPKNTSSLLIENILIGGGSPSDTQTTSTPEVQRPAPLKTTHRRLLSDLESLGISGPSPFKKSSRKERRPFTEEEDNNIMKGYTTYGPQWAKIQADKDLGLNERRSTDIRDRFRNRWKGIYEGLPAGENVFAAKRAGSTTKGESKRAVNGANDPESSQNISKVGTKLTPGTMGKNDSMTTEKVPASTLPSFPSTKALGGSEKPNTTRVHSSQNLVTLSSNSISNSYPLPSISSQANSSSGKEIFYQLPNPNSKPSSNAPNPLSLTSMNSEPILISSAEQLPSFSDNQSNYVDDNILAPFQVESSANTGLNMETAENGMGVQEIAENFNPSSIGEMDIQRFLLDDTWPLK